MEEELQAKLLSLAVEKGALKFGEFILSSGIKSSYYFDGRVLSLDPEGAMCIAQLILPIVRENGAEAIGGPALGAVPIVTAVALLSLKEGAPIPAFVVRVQEKEHGTRQRVEGTLIRGSKVLIVDDTCTTGSSLFAAIAAAEEAGCSVVKVVAILDRKQGGDLELMRRGFDFQAILAANDRGEITPVTM